MFRPIVSEKFAPRKPLETSFGLGQWTFFLLREALTKLRIISSRNCTFSTCTMINYVCERSGPSYPQESTSIYIGRKAKNPGKLSNDFIKIWSSKFSRLLITSTRDDFENRNGGHLVRLQLKIWKAWRSLEISIENNFTIVWKSEVVPDHSQSVATREEEENQFIEPERPKICFRCRPVWKGAEPNANDRAGIINHH